MLFIIALAVAFAFALFCGKSLKKHPLAFYLTAVLLTALTSFLPSVNTHALPTFVNNYIINLFSRGVLATALWCVVMITGALPNGSAPMKKLMPIRGELSIFTAILTLGHNISYGRTYFVMLFTDSEKLSRNQLFASICTIIMLAVMIPLTVMSFPKVRKKMDAKIWKKIQRSAYLFYALIYVHVMLLMIPQAKAGREGYIFNIFIYSLVFFGYAFFRVRKSALKRESPHKKIIANSAFVLAVLAVIFVPLTARPLEKDSAERSTESSIKTFSVGNTVTTTETSTTVTTTSATATITTTTTATTKTTATDTVTTMSETTETTEETTATTVTEEITEEIEEGIEEEIAEESEEEVVEEIREEEPTDMNFEEQDNPPENQQEEEPETEYETEAVPEIQYIYNDGDFSASAYGYDGEVYVTVTIENDVIVNISGYSNESDNWYFDSASEQVIPAILDSQSVDVDAFSGATYSSNAIVQAVKKALDSARK